MTKRHFRTKEERDRMITAYKTSGLNMKAWCRENNMPYSTFNKWCKKNEKQPEFLELKKAEIKKEKVQEIRIETGKMTIYIPMTEGLHLIENLMKEGN